MGLKQQGVMNTNEASYRLTGTKKHDQRDFGGRCNAKGSQCGNDYGSAHVPRQVCRHGSRGCRSLQSSVKSGQAAVGTENVVDEFVLPNLHASVFSALTGCTAVHEVKSLGVIESYSVASAIVAADTAVKASNVELIEVRLARGMGGKAMITMTGDVGAVTAAVRAGSEAIKASGFLVDQMVLPAPHSALQKSLL